MGIIHKMMSGTTDKKTETEKRKDATLFDGKKVLLPPTAELNRAEFNSDFTGDIWCVAGTPAVEKAVSQCPRATLELFDTEESLLQAWNKKNISKNWAKIRKAITEEDIYAIMDVSGWTYEEAAARAEKAFVRYGKTGKEYRYIKWKKHYNETPEADITGTWLQWRKKEVDKLEAGLDGIFEAYDTDLIRVAPRRMSAAQYASRINLARQIADGAITLKELCGSMGLTIPKDLRDKRNKPFSAIAYVAANVVEGAPAFCHRKEDAIPRLYKAGKALCVFGPAKYKEQFTEAGVPYIECSSICAHMYELASLWRNQFKKVKTVCITGTIGKTTTTELINHVALSTYKSICIWLNKNLPYQAAWHTESLDAETGVYVQEASGAAVAEMEKTTQILSPDIFVITNVGTGHIGLHGGSRMSLLYEKTTGDRRASADGMGIVNYDDELLRKVRFSHEVVWFSLSDPAADYHAENITEANGILSFDIVEKDGTRSKIALHAIGRHNAYDALAAFAAGIRLGIDRPTIAKALETYRSQGVRQNLIEAAGRKVFLDCYSATEDSMYSAIKTAASIQCEEGGRHIAVLGDIPDLEEKSEEIHRKVGRAVRDAETLDEVIFYGHMMASAYEEAKGGKAAVWHTVNRTELESWLSRTSRKDIVIFKASHKMELHRVSDDLLGTCYYLDDLRTGILGKPKKNDIRFVNVAGYGACAAELLLPTETLILPDMIQDSPLRQICNKAFAEKDIRTAVLPKPLISIGRDAFSGCRQLEEIKLPGSLYYIGIGAFRDCTALKYLSIPEGCRTIDDHAFAGCTALSKVYIPSSVLTISEGAFDPSCTAEFRCVRGSYAAEQIPALCPQASVVLIDEKDDRDALMPDISVFAADDKTGGACPDLRPDRTAAVNTKKKADKKEIQTITVAAAGDCTLGRNQKTAYKDSWDEVYQEKGPDYFLSKTASVFKQADLALVNLEGILSDDPKQLQTFYRQRRDYSQEKTYCHLGKPEYIQALVRAGIDVVSFANNHNIDYGVQGFIDTVKACDDYGLPVAYYDKVVRKKIGDITVGIVSVDFTYLSDQIGEGFLRKGIADLRRDCDLIIVSIHWGENYVENATKSQRKTGHLCIDLGADMVIGAHAHVLQGIERYKGRYIYYSLGNFSYGGRSVPRDNDTAIVVQSFTFVNGCFQPDDAVKLIPCWMSGKSSINDFCPVIKEGAAAQQIIDKINRESAFDEDHNLRFDDEGRPIIEKAVDIRVKVPGEAFSEVVPAIVYTLVNGRKKAPVKPAENEAQSV